MTDTSTISNVRPADISMDYERLREEGIQHLEALATEIWTDFNAHDPGITILEVLCYAITDLAYRANLPLEDLFAAGGGNAEPAFFPVQDVLPNKPVTANDYRKLLIDIDGVKNAWVYKYYTNDNLISTDVVLNGLYDFLIELEEGIPAEGKQANKLIEKVKQHYHANRNLAEDLARVRVVRDCPICLCLDLELALDTNEEEVMANVIFRIQEHLSPRPRFYSFQEMREKGYACEAIFNGPLLLNGFLPDSELDQTPLRRQIYKSDILGIIMETPGVLAVKSFLWRKASDLDSEGKPIFKDSWCLDVHTCGLMEQEDPCEIIYQAWLDVCCTRMQVTKGLLKRKLTDDDIKDEIALLELLRDMPIDRNLHQPPRGQYRADLADYQSIQYEFPDNYVLGDNGVNPNAPALRRAQQKQLQAFLLFFDQILAAYLQQLAQVRNLLSVQQDPEAATYFYNALHDVSGMPELVADFAVYALSQENIDNLQVYPDLPVSVVDQLNNLPSDFPATFYSNSQFKAAMRAYLGSSWDVHGATLKSAFREPSDADAWQNYCDAGTGAYFEGLQNLTETDTLRQLRRNQIMDHLLARFGEQFTAYSLQLFQTRIDRENDPSTQDFDTYLQCKAAYLREIPTLAAERGKAFNYRAKNKSTGEPDVWNSNNVAGLKKRVSRLLCIEDYSARSLLCDPGYDIRIKKGESSSGFPTYQLQLIKREGQQVLLESKVYSSRHKSKVIEIQEQLRKHLDQTDLYKVVPDGSKARVVYQLDYTNDAGEAVQVTLESPALSSMQQANDLLLRIQELVGDESCEREGFHLLEHILLRPNDADDAIIELKAGTCAADLTDQYSFIVSVILPDWPQRFRDANFRLYVEQLFRREAPAHILLRFCWIDRDEMQEFERPYQRWREELARCTTDECQVNIWANQLIAWLNNADCTCMPPLLEDEPYCKPRAGRIEPDAYPKTETNPLTQSGRNTRRSKS
ncbi:MAG TPA: hypothetical protein PKA00_04550 [Saprospiraceae bacterium]|nr:hypothetical protein [Saprospiraceae bacterium]HMQ82150.1 hypothetical protein [Saprospiraceae bacterium]